MSWVEMLLTEPVPRIPIKPKEWEKYAVLAEGDFKKATWKEIIQKDSVIKYIKQKSSFEIEVIYAIERCAEYATKTPGVSSEIRSKLRARVMNYVNILDGQDHIFPVYKDLYRQMLLRYQIPSKNNPIRVKNDISQSDTYD